MGYANPIERYGVDPFIADAARRPASTACWWSTIRPKSARRLPAGCASTGIDPIFLLAPTSTDERMRQVGRIASGYVYYVSLKGVTGAGHLDTDAVAQMIPRIRAHVKVPVGVGFGIRDAATARAVAAVSDAVVIGSALVQLLQASSRDDVAQAAPATSSPTSAARSTPDATCYERIRRKD